MNVFMCAALVQASLIAADDHMAQGNRGRIFYKGQVLE